MKESKFETWTSDERATVMRLRLLGYRESTIEGIIKNRRRDRTLCFLSGCVVTIVAGLMILLIVGSCIGVGGMYGKLL